MNETEEKKDFNSNYLKTLGRGLQVLEELCHHAGGVTQSEVARKLGVNRSTALRYLETLEAAGYAARAGEAFYRPTAKIAELARTVIDSLEIKPYAHEQLDRLTGQTGFSSHLALLSDGRIVYVDGEHAPGMVRVNADIGTTAPLHCSATGKALAAHIEGGKRKDIVAASLGGAASFPSHTGRTITDPIELEKEFGNIRQRGYAVDDEEYEPGVRCLAAPVFNSRGQVVAAIGISGTTARLDAPALPGLAVLVCQAAGKISRALGAASPGPAALKPGTTATNSSPGAWHRCYQ